MMYSKTEQKEIEKVITAFQEYLEQGMSVEIVYSKKSGYYLRLLITDGWPEGVEVIESAADLFDYLCYSIRVDYIEHIGKTFDDKLTETEEAELLEQANQYAAELSGYKVDYSRYMDEEEEER